MQCACAILSSVVCPALQYFSTLAHKRYDFKKKKETLLNTKYVFRGSVKILFDIFFILNRTERDFPKCILVFM